MAVESLVLAVNPGSASKKYALYKGSACKATVHFEHENGSIVATIIIKNDTFSEQNATTSLNDTAHVITTLLQKYGVLSGDSSIAGIGIRLVAPSSYFLQHRFMDDEALKRLKTLEKRAPLHITNTLHEITALRKTLPDVPLFAISDSAFHADKPDYAWNYGIELGIADQYEIKRFGYHGISVESVVQALGKNRLFEKKLIVCHLGSGSSVTAVKDGKSVDTTMGYSPLEGLMMATRSGTLDVTAAEELKHRLGATDEELTELLNHKSGLLGVSGISSDIRVLLEAEKNGDYRAKLALAMYVYAVQKAIGQMAAVLGGVDALIFTGTVGARSAVLRERITKPMDYLYLAVDQKKNTPVYEPRVPTKINPRTRIKPVFVVTTDETFEIAWRTSKAINSN